MYSNPPPEVDALKTMLLASATFTSVVGNSSRIHYPSAGIGNDRQPDAIPLVVIEPLEDAPRNIAPGVTLPGGKLQVLLYMDCDNGADIEKQARLIKDEVAFMVTGLPITGAQVGMASEPDGAFRAEQSYQDSISGSVKASLRTIPIIFTYGITG